MELVDDLLIELGEIDKLNNSYNDKRKLLHGIINTLPPYTLSDSGIEKLDRLLQKELSDKVLTDPNDLTKGDKIVVWQGDITTLKADAIVNAANNQMLGCFQPLHKCIDNAIHSGAGVRLRDECHGIMEKQGHPEATGNAKITDSYNLPSKYVIHTVGPIVRGNVTDKNREDLIRSYRSILELCRERDDIKNVAFCCISTGVFGYPQKEAAETAFEAVKQWIIENPEALDLVIFNVFTDKDRDIYNELANR